MAKFTFSVETETCEELADAIHDIVREVRFRTRSAEEEEKELADILKETQEHNKKVNQ